MGVAREEEPAEPRRLRQFRIPLSPHLSEPGVGGCPVKEHEPYRNRFDENPRLFKAYDHFMTVSSSSLNLSDPKIRIYTAREALE